MHLLTEDDSTFDKDTQYILAESTRTLDLEDMTKWDDPDDALWLGPGVTVTDVHDSICLYTLKALPNAAFEILDVLEDPRFAKIPCVTNTPYVRYYLGVPLKTKRGLAIGTLYVVDEKPRKPITQSQHHCELMVEHFRTKLYDVDHFQFCKKWQTT